MAAAAGAAGAAAAAARLRRWIEDANASLTPYAEARGMHFRPGRMGWARNEMPRLSGVVNDVPTALEMFVDSMNGHPYVAVFARPVIPCKGHVEAHREGILGKIARFFGAQDLVVGDEAFDRAFVVKATEEATARAVLSPAVMEEMLALGATRLAYDDGGEHGHAPMLVVEFPMEGQTHETLARAFSVVAGIANVREGTAAYR